MGCCHVVIGLLLPLESVPEGPQQGYDCSASRNDRVKSIVDIIC